MVEPVRIEPEALYDGPALRLALGVTSATLVAARKSGALKFTQRGARTFYKGAWILAWLESDVARPEAKGRGVDR
jgi:hypothetical protein